MARKMSKKCIKDNNLLFPKLIEKILKKPYHWIFLPDDGSWCAYIEEFKGCISCGDTLQEATEMLKEAAEFWLDACLEDDIEIPEPIADWDDKGKKVNRREITFHSVSVVSTDTGYPIKK
jgi:predicted RNase H-like HicB family nuclease